MAFFRYPLVYWYLTKEVFLTFVVSYVFYIFIFFVNNILYIAQRLAEQEIPFLDILVIVVYTLPHILWLSAPFASLLAGLLAMGNLSSNSEIIALQSLGISLGHIYKPFFIFSLFVFLLNFIIGDMVVPRSSLAYTKLYLEVTTRSPQLVLPEQSIKTYQDIVLITGSAQKNFIYDVLILDEDENRNKRVIQAKRASIESSEEEVGIIGLRLDEVFVLAPQEQQNSNLYYFKAQDLIYNFILRELSNAGSLTVSPAQMTTWDIYQAAIPLRTEVKETLSSQKQGLQKRKQDLNEAYWQWKTEGMAAETVLNKGITSFEGAFKEDSQIFKAFNAYKSSQGSYEREYDHRHRRMSRYVTELYQKFSFPVVCIVFFLLSFSVGLTTRRMTRTTGFIYALAFAVLFWVMWTFGRSVGIELAWSPFLSIWGPVLLILAVSVFFYIRKVYK